MYIYGQDIKTKQIFSGEPCRMCKRMIINAGIEKVVTSEREGMSEHNVKDWLNDEMGFVQ